MLGDVPRGVPASDGQTNKTNDDLDQMKWITFYLPFITLQCTFSIQKIVYVLRWDY